MFKKLLFVFAVLLLFCGFAGAQTELWGGLGVTYSLASTSTTTKQLVSHGIGLSGRISTFNAKAKVGFHANLGIDYIIQKRITFSDGSKLGGLDMPVTIKALLGPAFKFSLAKNVVFFIFPGIHAAIMPEFAFGIGADAGFNFQFNSRVFMGLGTTGAFNFVGVNFFEGGNLKRYTSFSLSPYVSIGWRSIR